MPEMLHWQVCLHMSPQLPWEHDSCDSLYDSLVTAYLGAGGAVPRHVVTLLSRAADTQHYYHHYHHHNHHYHHHYHHLQAHSMLQSRPQLPRMQRSLQSEPR